MTDDAYALNAGLAEWAYGITKDVKAPDNAAMATDRKRWVGFPKAMVAPGVIRGDSFTSDSYWHGAVMTRYANDWVSLWTKGKGNFAMSNMEDSGIAEAMQRLERMHRADYQRLMVLRVASNYTMQAPGQTAVESVTAPYIKSTAYEGCWVVGSVVVRELVEHWGEYEGKVPGR
jgi:purine nucleoside permease